ncbi:MAG TPA: ATP-binding cassette domain-containing protein [Chryseolinea sp.]|jgi:putative ABC transport system ATP-binding protein|nr:ATP-binding cassette domain-containing protein [Chryseolinea sp.]
MVSISDLSYKFSNGPAISFPDFTVKRGEHFLLLGESGSGKTTLLHLLGGLLRNYSGSIQINGVALETLNEHQLDKFRGQNIGFIFQRNHLISALTVEQNLMMHSYLASLPLHHARVEEVLDGLGIADKRRSDVSHLSQGQAQRVAIARAVISKPSVIFADEPTSALDDRHCNNVISLLIDVANQNQSTLLIATHDQRLKDRIERKIILKD